MAGRAGSEDGLMLLEVLIGGIFLAIALVGVSLMFSEGRSYVRAEGDDRVAVALAQQKIDRIRALGFGCIPLSPVTPPAADTPVPRVNTSCENDLESDGVTPTKANLARRYTETSVTESTLGRFATRQTTVICADPNSMLLNVTCPNPPTGKLITVEVTPIMTKAKAVRVQTFVATH